MKYFILYLLFFCFTAVYPQTKTRYIDVNGTAELMVQADQINFTIQINIVGKSIEKSKKSGDKHLNELLAILKNIDIDSSDIEILPVTLGKNYEFVDGRREQKGFYTEIKVDFLLRDLSKYYELINKLSLNDNFEILNSSYGISDYEHRHVAANKKALKAAKDKAEYMAKTLGVNLGEVLEIEENNFWRGYSLASNSISAETPQSNSINGKVTIRRSVRVKFAIR